MQLSCRPAAQAALLDAGFDVFQYRNDRKWSRYFACPSQSISIRMLRLVIQRSRIEQDEIPKTCLHVLRSIINQVYRIAVYLLLRLTYLKGTAVICKIYREL